MLGVSLAFSAQPGLATPAWPKARPITWVVGFAPGGTADAQTRLVATRLSQYTGQPVRVENRPGGAGALALRTVAAAPADGYTIVTVAGPVVVTEQGVPGLGQGLAPVALLAQHPLVLVGHTHAGQPAGMRDLLAALRRQPAAWSYASSGVGSLQHLAGEQLNQQMGIRMLHVPYKGGAEAVREIAGGQVPLGILGVVPVLSHVRSGRLTAYAVTGKERLHDLLPQVPTLQEAGIPGDAMEQWYVVAVSDKVPSQHVAQLNRWINEITASKAVKAALAEEGSTPGAGSPADVQAFVRAQTEQALRLARSIGVVRDN